MINLDKAEFYALCRTVRRFPDYLDAETNPQTIKDMATLAKFLGDEATEQAIDESPFTDLCTRCGENLTNNPSNPHDDPLCADCLRRQQGMTPRA